MGAVIVPIILWYLRIYLLKKFSLYKDINDSFYQYYKSLSTKRKLQITSLFVFIFLFMELCLRIVFEFVIAYFDMHEYLSHISKAI
jgi:hypothetical protein